MTKIDDISKSLSLCGKILLHTFVGVEEVRSHFLAPKLVSLPNYSHPDSLETVSWVQLTPNLLLEHLFADKLDDQFGQAILAMLRFWSRLLLKCIPNLYYHHHNHMHKLRPCIQLLDYLADLALDRGGERIACFQPPTKLVVAQFRTKWGIAGTFPSTVWGSVGSEGGKFEKEQINLQNRNMQ